MTTPNLPEAAKLAREALVDLGRVSLKLATDKAYRPRAADDILRLMEPLGIGLEAALSASAEPTEPVVRIAAWIANLYSKPRDIPYWTNGRFASDCKDAAEALLYTAPTAVQAEPSIEGDFVEHSHPQFGQGYFCTPDVFAKLSAPAQAEPSAQEPAVPAKWLPAPASPAHKLVSDAEYLRLFEEARKGSDKPSGVIRGIRACVAAYEMASPDSVAAAVQAPAEGAPGLAAIPYEQHEAALLEEIDNRDRFHEWADKLANAIADHFDIKIGEHSSANCPWEIALLAITNQPDTPQPQPPSPEQAQAKQDVQAVPLDEMECRQLQMWHVKQHATLLGQVSNALELDPAGGEHTRWRLEAAEDHRRRADHYRAAAESFAAPTSPAPGAAPPVQPLQYPDHLDILSTLRADVPLTDEQIEALALKHESGGAGLAEGGGVSSHFFCADDMLVFARAIEAAIRNQGADK